MESGEKPFKTAAFLLESKPRKTSKTNTLLELSHPILEQYRVYTHIPSEKEEQFNRVRKKAIKLTIICSFILVLLSAYLMPADALFRDKCAVFLVLLVATSIGLCSLISMIFNRIDNLMFGKERKDKFDKYMEKVEEINEKMNKKRQEKGLIIDG
jgi:hypothetical protein